MIQQRLLERLMAALAATTLAGAGCSGSSIENSDGAAGADDNDGGGGLTTGGASSGGSSTGGRSLGGTSNVEQGGTSGTTTGGTGAVAGAGDGGTTGIGGTPADAGAGAGGVTAGRGGAGGGGAGSGGAGSGGGTGCGCPMKCYEWNAVPQNMGGTGGSTSGDRIFAGNPGAPAAGAGGGVPLPCPPASAVSLGAVCGGTAPPAVLGPMVIGPTFQGTQCCYSVTPSCGGAGGGGGVPGRPFIIEREARIAGVANRDDWTHGAVPPAALSESVRQRLGRAWLDDALLEHASVAAFARFTLELLALGAPSDLVQASQAAALDEIEHAKLCFAAASRYLGRALGPAKLDVRAALEQTSLHSFARRTFEEGCVGETLAALLAAEALDRASDPFVRALLERIVEDETRHAELAWRAVQWAIASGGPSVVEELEHALVELRERESHVASCADDIDDIATDTAWHAHGRLTRAQTRALRQHGFRAVVAPCFEALCARLGGADQSAYALGKRPRFTSTLTIS